MSVGVGVDVLRSPGGGERLRVLLIAGVADSAGLAFGWTVYLLTVTQRSGLGAAGLQTSAMLAGVALSAPFVTWLTPRLSPRGQLRVLAVTEGGCRLLLFVLLGLGTDPRVMAVLVALLNVLAWAGFAAMRSEAARIQGSSSARSLTWYAVAITATEALAAGAASLTLGSDLPPLVLTVVGSVYVLSLIPQWLVARGALPEPLAQLHPHRVFVRTAPACLLGGAVVLVAGGPALLATALAFELYGPPGVLVSAVAFASASLGAARVQALVGDRGPAPVVWCLLGALLAGGWAVAGAGLVGLVVAQACAGVAMCTLEGDMDARVTRRLPPGTETATLAMASASRAVGGAVAVAILPPASEHVALPALAAVTAAVMLTAAGASWWVRRVRFGRGRRGRHAAPRTDWSGPGELAALGAGTGLRS